MSDNLDAPPPFRRHNFGKPLPPEQRGYDANHRRLRRELLRDNPSCELGCGRLATVADHRKPLCLGGKTVKENMTALCEPCHRTKSSLEANYIRWHVRPGLARNGRAKP